ncbi:hypothetical protein Golob_023672 [Gossypium lobatum]|uniref:Uncharacterized protein n=1 Tax=Gossypium lobatum TaxID=34289 RepID=A0A7J8LKD7_9ROSI|nr:hypothetical protein [Gossypium lobatum]
MALSQSNHDSKIFVSATPYNVYKDDQSLGSPFITFKFNIKMSYNRSLSVDGLCCVFDIGCLYCVVSSILDVCSDMINAARESGRKKLFLLVMIKKQVVVPRDEYLAMLKAKEG